MLVTAGREVRPGETLAIPSGTWPVALLGTDGLVVFSSTSQVEQGQIAARAEGGAPVHLTVVLPWGGALDDAPNG